MTRHSARTTSDAPPPWELLDPMDYLQDGYRAFLRDWLSLRKAHPSRGVTYTLGMFAREARATKSALINVIAGRENLSPARLDGFCRALRLPTGSEQMFRLLVQRDQLRAGLATTGLGAPRPQPAHRRRDEEALARVEAELEERVARRSARRLEEQDARFRYLSNPLLPPLRELVGRLGFRPDPAWVAAQLVVEASPGDVEAGIQTLLELGVLVEGPGGRYVHAEPTLLTEFTGAGRGAFLFHRATHAIEANLFASADDSADPGSTFRERCRFVSGVVWIPKAYEKELDERLKEFHESLLTWSEGLTPGPGQLQLVGLRRYPLSAELDPQKPPPRKASR